MRELLTAWLHLAVLWSFAFAKPLFDVLADSPEFFVARGNTRGDILLFAFAMVLVPPTLMVAVEAAAVRVPRVRQGLHLVFVGVLAAAFAVQLLDDALGGSGKLLVLVAVVLGALAALAYARTTAASTVLSVLGPAPLVFLILFLVISPVSKLVLPQDTATAAGVDIDSNTPVVLVVFDEFDPNMLLDGKGQIDATRYPNFAAFAREATLYRNATTVNSQTTLAVPALLSGRVPDKDELPIAADYPDSVFTLLGGSHTMNATETATEVCPERLCGKRAREATGDRLSSLAQDLGIVSLHLVTPESLEHRLPAVDQTFGDFGGGGRDRPSGAGQPDVPEAALRNRPSQLGELIEGIPPTGGKPSFDFVHTALPHIPWQYLPSGQQYINAGPDYPGLLDEQWSGDAFPARLGMQRHLLQLGYTDTLVGKLIRRLRQTGLWDRAMVILTADHGVSYRAGDRRRAPTPTNFSDIAAVPLLIKYPGEREGRVDDSFVRTVDIVPTIADRLGVKLPWKADGRPIGSAADGGEVTVGVGASGRNESLDFSEFVRRREEGLQRLIALFGAADGGRRLYANGPNWDLLGRPVARLATAPATGARVELDSGAGLDDFDPADRVVPSFISGRVTGGLEPGVSVAVAVNGKVRGITQSFRDGDDLRIAAVVPADSFRAGSNTVDVYAVEGSGSERRLARLSTGRPQSYRLVEDNGGTTIQGAGRKISVAKGLEGFVDRFETDDQGARVGGWAVDPSGPRAAQLVLLFAKDRLVAQGRPSLVRPDIRQRYGSEAVFHSGFELRGAAAGASVDDLRVFAVSGDRATELPRYER